MDHIGVQKGKSIKHKDVNADRNGTAVIFTNEQRISKSSFNSRNPGTIV
jgi:hypothetical protein